jgi:preprotein translocase subunit YajC
MTGRGMLTEGCPVIENAFLAAGTSKSSGSGYFFLVIIVVLFGLLYFVTIRPQRRRQQAAQQTQRQLEPGMRVRTTAGMYATVAAVEDQEVILEVAPGVNVRFLRRAIMDVVPDPSQDYSQAEAEEPEPAEPESLDETEDGAAKGG